MKLYSQLSLLIALCTFIVTVHPMGKLCFDVSPIQTLNYPTFEQELKLRLNKYPNNFDELNKSCQHMAYQIRGRNINPVQILPSGKSFGEQLIEFNYIDLLSQFLDHVSIKEHQDEYRKWLTFGIKSGNTKAVNVILDHTSDGFIDASYVSLAVNSFVDEKVNSLPIIKLLLTRNVIWERSVEVGLLAKITSKGKQPISDDNKKPYLRTLIVSGANHDACTKVSLARGGMISLTPMDVASYDLKPFLLNVAVVRDTLFAIVQDGMNIGFIRAGDYSRRHIKDIRGNNLLYYALLGKNKVVADKLFGLWPKMLWEKNFQGKAIVNHEQAMHNFTEMYLQDDELNPLAIMFSYLLKKIS